MSDFTAGAAAQQALRAGNIIVAPFICYETAYPELALDFMPNANLLLTVSDDSWFGKSLAAYQQFEMARMRSLETGRYQIVATNTGVTGIINPESLIVALAPTSQSFVLNAIVHPMQGSTPWVAFGHHLWIVLMIICLLVGGPRITNLERH
jgi:apolipoprotein N-acyltransferase